jgi:O-Antigen ligase
MGVIMGRWVSVLFSKARGDPSTDIVAIDEEANNGNFIIGLVILLALSSWWHLNLSLNIYYRLRWMGLWNDPDIYGMLMSVGMVLAIGFLVAKWKAEGGRWKSVGSQNSEAEIQNRARQGENISWFLLSFVVTDVVLYVAVFMLGVGLLFSYSRGAWLGTAVGLLYLAKVYGKFKWYFVLLGILLVGTVVCFFWKGTPDSSSWYIKRMDFARPSAQHRVAAWKAGFEIMRDHPFGLGWNNTIETYEKYYSPPEDGAAAIVTNDYIMLGTQLGLPALICFLAYVALCFGRWKIADRNKNLDFTQLGTQKSEFKAKVACRAGALAMLVEFWFDAGLFELPTAVVFWILLELGTSHSKFVTNGDRKL